MSAIYKYPDNIAKAASLLDSAKPGWSKNINLMTLNMHSLSSCILGQVYGSYTNGMKSLFGLTFSLTHPNPYSLDTVFGSKADIQDWIDQISLRNKEEEFVIQGLGVHFHTKYVDESCTGMMVRNNNEYNLVMNDGNQWDTEKIPKSTSKITKSELEKIYGIIIDKMIPNCKFILCK